MSRRVTKGVEVDYIMSPHSHSLSLGERLETLNAPAWVTWHLVSFPWNMDILLLPKCFECLQRTWWVTWLIFWGGAILLEDKAWIFHIQSFQYVVFWTPSSIGPMMSFWDMFDHPPWRHLIVPLLCHTTTGLAAKKKCFCWRGWGKFTAHWTA